MKSCPSCRTKFDPTFTVHCPECGASIDPTVASMQVPEATASSEDLGPAGSPSSVGGRVVWGLGIRLIVALLVLGVGGIVNHFQGRDADPPGSDIQESVDLTLGEAVNPGDLAIGDCVMWPDGEEDTFASLERLDCALAHDAEVYALLDHPAGSEAEYPGNDIVADWGVQACYEEFTSYVGRSYEDAQELEYTFFTPTELGWTKYDDRMVQCLVFNADESTLTGTVRTQA